jgi:hypothetical protein
MTSASALCALRAACCVLRAACCVLCAMCCAVWFAASSFSCPLPVLSFSSLIIVIRYYHYHA